jgi:hypothetical protein
MQSFLSQLSPLSAAIILVVVLLAGFVLARLVAPSKIVTKVIKSVEDEAMDLIEKQIALLADDSADQKAIIAANQSMTDRRSRMSRLYFKVSQLAPQYPSIAPAPSTGSANALPTLTDAVAQPNV